MFNYPPAPIKKWFSSSVLVLGLVAPFAELHSAPAKTDRVWLQCAAGKVASTFVFSASEKRLWLYQPDERTLLEYTRAHNSSLDIDDEKIKLGVGLQVTPDGGPQFIHVIDRRTLKYRAEWWTGNGNDRDGEDGVCSIVPPRATEEKKI